MVAKNEEQQPRGGFPARSLAASPLAMRAPRDRCGEVDLGFEKIFEITATVKTQERRRVGGWDVGIRMAEAEVVLSPAVWVTEG